MSDSNGPKPTKNIPSQQQPEPDPPNTPPQAQPERNSPPSRTALIEQASRFLDEDSIRDAPLARKEQFLESKGLTGAETDTLLEMQQQQTPEAAVTEDDGVEERGATGSTATSPPTTAPQSKPAPSPTTPAAAEHAPATASSTDRPPPIITYPEFLLHAQQQQQQQPAPLITADRLLTSLYVASGAAATVYGTSRYVVEPMVESLTGARHSLFEGAHADIEALNKRLEGAVSRVPETATAHPADEDVADTDSVSSDGARFFSRSAGTQTSPRRSRSPSSASSELEEPLSPTQNQTNALLEIHGKLSDFLPTEGGPKNPIGDSLEELRTYLDKLPYENSIYPGRRAGRKGEVDAVANVKAAIRGVKGVLLSARNFPSGVAAR